MASKEFIGMSLTGLGIIDTLFLMDETFNKSGICGGPGGRLFGTPIDCGYVLHSDYSSILGVPLSVIGFLYYATIFTLYFMSTETRVWIPRFILVIVSLGFIASMIFVYIQFAILKLVCLYCMGSALTTTVLLGFNLLVFRQIIFW